MVRMGSSNKTNKADRAEPSGGRPTIELYWQSPTPTTTTKPVTTVHHQTSRKNKTFHRLRRGRQKALATYKTPKVQSSMEGYIQRTPLSEGAAGAPRGGSST